MRFTPTKKISELEALNSATLDTTFVVGISGSTTYKISINQLTSSLDTAFATDLVTTTLSNTLDTKLATTIFNTNSASFHSRINAVSSSVSTGTSGTSGTNGTQGNQGTTGPQGNQGPQGESGTSGTSGTGGTSGTSGTSGTAGLTAFTSLKLFAGGDAGSYIVDYGYFNYNSYGNSLAIAKTALFNLYLDFVGTGSQNWTLKSLNPTYPSFTIDLGTPQTNTEIPAPSKDIWVLPFAGVNISELVGVPNGNEYAFYLTKTGALGTSGAQGPQGINGTAGSSGVQGSQGPTGPQGNQGANGSNGTNGSQGNQGPQGNQGATGSGMQGAQGPTGPQGTQGTQGNQGNQGTQGTTFNISQYSGSVGITGSLTVSSIGISEYALLTNTSSLTLTSGSNLYVQNNGIVQITGSLIVTGSTNFTELTGSLASFSSSVDSRIKSGSSVAGTISSSAQISALGYATTSSLNVVSASAWGAFQSASSYSSSLQSSITNLSSSVDSRLDNQEAFSSSLTTLSNKSTKILDAYYTSATAWSGSYTGTGGTVKVEANFAMYASPSTGTKTFALYRDGVAVDSGSFYFNQANVHTVMPTLYYIGENEIGTHTYSVGHNAYSDVNDSCNIIVTETFNSLNIEGNVNYVQVLGASKTLSTINTNIISGSITTSGNPVQIMITGDANPVSSTGQWCQLQIYRDGSAIGQIIQVESSAQNENIPYCLNIIDTPVAGAYTYSMRMVTNSGGNFQYGEASGPVLTAVELKTNTNLPSLNNTFTGNNTFDGVTRFETVGGDEGGEIEFGVPQTNTSLSTRVVADVFQNRLRIFDGNTKGVFIDLSKAPTGVAGEITWKTSGYVNAGTFLTLDNLKVTCSASGNRGLSIGAVSSNFTANVSGNYGMAGGGSGAAAYNVAYTTSAATSAFGWSFGNIGDTSTYIINDTTNSRVYRVILMIGASFNNNFISIERLH